MAIEDKDASGETEGHFSAVKIAQGADG